MSKTQKPDHVAGLCGKDKKNCGGFLLSSLRGLVNLSGLFFQNRPLAGLLVSGFWVERLTIWLPALDMAARLLRALVEVQV